MFLSTVMQYFTQLLPHSCLLCGYRTRTRLCPDCKNDLPITPKSCPQCGQFLTNLAHITAKCAACIMAAPPFNRLFALFPYQPPVKQCIAELKFHQQLPYANLFAELLMERITTSWYHDDPLPNIIIPIPLHAKRLRERGYNQTLEIAKPVSKSLQIPIDTTGVVRQKPTLAQSGLSRQNRAANVSNAFRIRRDYTDQHLALLDDVVTTGQTIRECSRVLKAHGAARIDIWCCARRG